MPLSPPAPRQRAPPPAVGTFLDVAGLDAEEAEGPQVVLDLIRHRRREVLGRGKPREQGRRDAVDLLVGLLGRQDRGDQELPVGAMVKRDGGVGIGLAQPCEQPDDALVRGRAIGGGSGGSHVHLIVAEATTEA